MWNPPDPGDRDPGVNAGPDAEWQDDLADLVRLAKEVVKELDMATSRSRIAEELKIFASETAETVVNLQKFAGLPNLTPQQVQALDTLARAAGDLRQASEKVLEHEKVRDQAFNIEAGDRLDDRKS